MSHHHTLRVFQAIWHHEGTTKEQKAKLLAIADQYVNPVGAIGVKYPADHKDLDMLFGKVSVDGTQEVGNGAGTLSGQGQDTFLGGVRIGHKITVCASSPAGVAHLVLELWMPWARAPIATWEMNCPSTKSLHLVGRHGSGAEFGSPCFLKARGVSGTFPVNLTFSE